jgi:hypothetical protein
LGMTCACTSQNDVQAHRRCACISRNMCMHAH